MNSNLAELMADECDEVFPEEIFPEEVFQEEILEKNALTLYEQAKSIKITSPVSYADAGQFAKVLKDMRKEIEEFFAPMKAAAAAAHKAICSKEKETLQPVLEADTLVRKALTGYLDEQERIKREAERKLRLEAEEKARKEQEKLQARAAKAEEKGQIGKAEELREQAAEVYVPPVTVASAVDKSVQVGEGGLITRKTEIQVTVTDLKALCAEIAAGRIPTTVIDVKIGAIKTWAKINQVKSCPGILIEEVSSVSVR